MTPKLRSVRIARSRIALTKAKLRLKLVNQKFDEAWRAWHAVKRSSKKAAVAWSRVLKQQGTLRKALREVDSLTAQIKRLDKR